jgi:hypothetical protein
MLAKGVDHADPLIHQKIAVNDTQIRELSGFTKKESTSDGGTDTKNSVLESSRESRPYEFLPVWT